MVLLRSDDEAISFLLAKLHMQSIQKSVSLKDISAALASLPPTLLEAYTQSLDRIQKESNFQKPAKIISWIFRARRPLLLREMQQALTISIGDSFGSIKQDPSLSEMVEWCHGLVIIDEERSKIGFLHLSFQEFLQGGHFQLEDDCFIARLCLTFLNFENFAEGYCTNNQALEQRSQEFPLLEYAARYWAIHGKDCCDNTFEQLAIKFLCSEGHLSCATQAAGYTDYMHHMSSTYGRTLPRRLSGLHVVASYGLVQLIDVLVHQSSSDVNVKDDHDQTPVLYAAKQGHTSVVKALVDKGAVLDIRDKTHLRSALSWATLNGHKSVVEWL